MRARKGASGPKLGEEQAEFLDHARGVAIDAIVEALADVHRVKRLRDDEAERRAGFDRGDASPRISVETGASLGDVLFNLARLQLDIFNRVLHFQRKHRDLLFDRLRSAPGRSGCMGTPDALLLEGALGTKVRGTFVVENRGSASAQVSVSLSTLRGRASAPVLVDAEFAPASPFDLQADSELELSVEVDLDASSFEAGCRYRGHVQIVIAGGTKQSIPLRIDVARAPDPASRAHR